MKAVLSNRIQIITKTIVKQMFYEKENIDKFLFNLKIQ